MEGELGYIEFGVMSPEDVFSLSVVELVNHTKSGDGSVYDEKLGPLDNRNCKTCLFPGHECPGHFGHVKLFYPVINPLLAQRLTIFLNIFCLDCKLPIISNKKINVRPNRNESYHSMLCAKSKKTACFTCKKQPTEYIYQDGSIYSIIENHREMVDLDFIYDKLSSIDLDLINKSLLLPPRSSHPCNYIIKNLPVLPHLNRPFMIQNSQICDDDLTTLYVEIIKSNEKLKLLNCKGTPEFYDYNNKIIYAVHTIFDNNKGNVRHPSSGRNVKSLIHRTSGKNGCLRNHCMGKRSDQTARAVITPGPHLKCDEVELPDHIMNILTLPILCTGENIAHLQSLCDEGKVDTVHRLINGVECEFAVKKFCNLKQDKLKKGWIILRDNELPTRVETGKEIVGEKDIVMDGNKRVDFKLARKRRFEIKINDKISVYLQDGDIVMINRQPTLHTGSILALRARRTYDMTIKIPLSITPSLNADFDGDELNVHVIQSEEGRKELYERAHVRNALISPSNGNNMVELVQDTVLALYLMTKTAEYVPGKYIGKDVIERVLRVRGAANIEPHNGGEDSLALFSSCLPESLCVNTEKYQILCGVWISGVVKKNIINELIKIVCHDFGKDVACDMITKMQHISTSWLTRRGFSINGDDFEAIDHNAVELLAEKMINEGEDTRTVRDAIHNLIINTNNCQNLLDCVESGAKGTLLNIGQIKGLLGQQQQKCGYIPDYIVGNRVISHDINCTDKYQTAKHKGFIVSSYTSGLDMRELFIHLLPSRDSIINTSTGTANSGYMQHKMIKRLDDIVTEKGQVVYNSGEPCTISLTYNKGRHPTEISRPGGCEKIFREINSI